MKLTTGILALAITMVTAAAGAQNPAVIDNTRSTPQAVQHKTSDSNAVLLASSPQATKPAAGAPAPAVKPAAIPGAKPATTQAKPAASASSHDNELQSVNVKHAGDDVQIEIKSREAVTPKVSKLSSPARVLVELPSTVMQTAQSKIPVGSNGVKGVRIGMDGKTPPTTSVVVDLEQACGYELTPGPGNSFVLTLHTQTAVAKSTSVPAPAKTVMAKATPPAPVPAKMPAAKAAPAPVPVQSVQKNSPTQVPAVQAKPNPAPMAAGVAKPHDVFKPKTAAAAPAVTVKAMPPAAISAKPGAQAATIKPGAPAPTAKTAANEKPGKPGDTAKPAAPAPNKIAVEAKPAEPAKTAEAPKPKPEEKKWAMTGKRDPFFSPVVEQPTGSGCSTGKKCLDVGDINLRGVVKSEAGFIAVVTNSANKAYFLHENDPVFNGYVMKITGDSVVFQQTVPDKLGKPFTKEVVKRVVAPAV